MDTRKIADLLRATIDPNQQQQAEDQLTQVRAHVVFFIGPFDTNFDIITMLTE